MVEWKEKHDLKKRKHKNFIQQKKVFHYFFRSGEFLQPSIFSLRARWHKLTSFARPGL